MTTDELYRHARAKARRESSVVLRGQEHRLVALANERRLLKSELAELVATRTELRLREGSSRRRRGWLPFAPRTAAPAGRKP